MTDRSIVIASASGSTIALPSWGRSFWQDPNDGGLICLYASGNFEVDFVYSLDSGNNWSVPQKAFSVDNFSTHNNFDSVMDEGGNIHCAFRYNNSGCYSLLAKNTISDVWSSSGVMERGFVDVSDAGEAKGFNGSIAAFGSIGLVDDVPGPYPAARIAAKDSTNLVNQWYIPNPFTSFPILQSMSPGNTINAGREGGFPIYTDAGGFGGPAIAYSVDATGIVFAYSSFGTWSTTTESVRIDNNAFHDAENTTALGSGFVGRVPLGPNMAWCKSYCGAINPILCSMSGARYLGWELYTTASESQGVGNYFGTVLSKHYGAGGNYNRYENVDDENSTEYPFGIMDSSVYGGTPWMSGGAPVDISIGNKPNNVIMYFQNRQPNGYQTIYKYSVDLDRQTVAGTRTLFTLPTLQNSQSGLIPFADVDRSTTGGSGLIMHWQKFKALKHPVQQGLGVTKKEMVVTVGSGLNDTATRLYSWDYDDSVWNSYDLKQPSFSIEWTALSGTEFVGIKRQGGINSTGLANLFDGLVGNECLINNGDFIVLEFSRPLPFSRMEFLYQKGTQPWLGVDVDASLDDVNYKRVHSIPSGIDPLTLSSSKLIKSSAEFDSTLDTDINDTFDTFIAKYIKFNFNYTNLITRSVREIRLYGGHSLVGGWETTSFNKYFDYSPIEYGFNSRIETFDKGVTPSGWRTSGDWNFFVDSGYVPSGVFVGQTVGSGDLYAMRSARYAAINTSGILEVDINVSNTERTSAGAIGRDIGFDTRYDLQGIGLLTDTDPADDKFKFYVVTGGVASEVSGFYATANQWLSEENYYSVRATAPVGLSTLRWVYQRGSTPSNNSDQGVVWVDNILGVDTSIYSHLSINSYLEGRAPNTSDFTSSSGINAYISGIAAPTGMVNAYIEATTASITGTINGYLKKVEASGYINAYLDSNGLDETIYAFTSGSVDSASSTINAYVMNSGVSGIIYGLIKATVNEYIFGYVAAPSGDNSTIYAYINTPEFSSIYGYIKGPAQITGMINAYLDSLGDQGNIYAYISGFGPPTGMVNAYLLNTGVSGSINAVIVPGENEEIYAYIKGAEAVTGVINAYISGVGFEDSTINAYIPGISGVASGIVNAYLLSSELVAGRINAVLVGFDGSGVCDFPLTPLPSFVIPTGNFFS